MVDSALPSTARHVALTLSTFMSGNGVCWPSKKTIAAKCGFGSLRTVDRAVDQLEAAGLLAVSRSYGRSSNQYQALLTAHHERGSDHVNRALNDTQLRTWKPVTAHDVPGKARNANERSNPEYKKRQNCPICGPLNVTTTRRLIEHLEDVHWVEPSRARELATNSSATPEHSKMAQDEVACE